ncbi:MAG: SAM-dependent methyltransferase [Nitrospirae bacterium]|nr:SAM-dependent methyltransferase [Nitrospirota bacterium]
MNFEAFMETALYHPEHGYYTSISNIGKKGDFYTSPHLHPIFGAMLSRQLQEMWRELGTPPAFHIVEMGAGMGYLAKDILGYLKGQAKDFFDCIQYTIVEISPALKAEQQRLLKEFNDKTCWVSGMKELSVVSGCFLTNELLDAFPVKMVEMDDELMEVYVTVDNGELKELKLPCSKEVKEYFKEFSIALPKGFRTEVNLKVHKWIRDVSERLKEGFLLTIDYGYSTADYYSEERNKGSLLCYYKHRINEDPYQNIGIQDITAHVNFSSLKRWGEDAGLKAIGFCSQGTFLVSLGIDEVIAELYEDSAQYASEIAKIKGLIIPGGIGETHKVMCQYKGNRNPALRGFSLRNQKKVL